MSRLIKSSFSVTGKEGSALDGEGFIQRLWNEANDHFAEIKHLAKRAEDGSLVGIWGAMSDRTHSYQPWEDNFREGLYLAGIECEDEAEAPLGWTKWTIPSFEYLVVANKEGAFDQAIAHLRAEGIPLAGAVHEYIDPVTTRCHLYVPIRKIE